MHNEKIGQFIYELRKSKQMTQKDLAAKLNITDKNELLNGEKSNFDSEDVEVTIDNALSYANKTVKNKLKSLQDICAIVFSLLLLIGIIACSICDIAISGAFTWSLFPISSIIFAWLVFFPVIKFGGKGVLATMIAISVFIVPFLYVLENLIKVSDLILPIGIRMAVISIAFLWCIFVLFKILKTRKLIAAAVSLLIAIPIYILINFSLSQIISEPLIDVWDILSLSIIVIAAITFFVLDFRARKK